MRESCSSRGGAGRGRKQKFALFPNRALPSCFSVLPLEKVKAGLAVLLTKLVLQSTFELATLIPHVVTVSNLHLLAVEREERSLQLSNFFAQTTSKNSATNASFDLCIVRTNGRGVLTSNRGSMCQCAPINHG